MPLIVHKYHVCMKTNGNDLKKIDELKDMRGSIPHLKRKPSS